MKITRSKELKNTLNKMEEEVIVLNIKLPVTKYNEDNYIFGKETPIFWQHKLAENPIGIVKKIDRKDLNSFDVHFILNKNIQKELNKIKGKKSLIDILAIHMDCVYNEKKNSFTTIRGLLSMKKNIKQKEVKSGLVDSWEIGKYYVCVKVDSQSDNVDGEITRATTSKNILINDWRLATKEEIELFNKGVRNINHIKDLTNKLPLGLIPKHIYEEQKDKERLSEVQNTIKRYFDEGLTITIDWIEEYNELIYKIKQYEENK